MKTKLASMKTQRTTLHNGSRTCAMTAPAPARRPVLALLVRLLSAAALVLPAFGAQAGVALTNLYSFQGFTDGAAPYVGLVQGSDGFFYGTTLDNWANLGTNVTAAGTTLNATDSVTNAPRRFYRVVLLP